MLTAPGWPFAQLPHHHAFLPSPGTPQFGRFFPQSSQVLCYGVPGEGKQLRWCRGCAKIHAGAVATASKECEGYGLKHASFGVPQYRPLLDTRWYRMVRNGYIIPG